MLFSGSAVSNLHKDYYTILDVPATSTPEQIKEAYRRLVKKHHPDTRMGSADGSHQPDADRFREITEAYQVLSVKQSRVNYDL